jgi:hypothetical protein
MARKLIDISVALQITYLDHHATAPGIAEYFGVGIDQLPQGEYAAIEKCEISTHNGTHLDAPYLLIDEPCVEGGRRRGRRSWRDGGSMPHVPAEIRRSSLSLDGSFYRICKSFE